eukprot:TRINITY_DN4754_c0_g1_i1.p1 TRINITY_DN4754_c0_g1~~TRINITY_DN4754_c0_g1_i1.p1  ORF type:complete len:152 (-),score=70.63 TRINITY_DN4754_c0_g1_i1:97-552(-)
MVHKKPLSEAQLLEIKEAFAVFDRNNDGHICVVELTDAMRALGQNPTDEEVKDMVRGVDADGSGTISFEEFTVMMRGKMGEETSQDEFRQAFATFDKDGNGYITSSELQQVMESIGDPISEEQANQMIREADADGDNRINYEEFLRLMGLN